MKAKYLFGMLLGGAMLAACSADDDLSLAPAAQDANQSAPVFTVSFDGENGLTNRATWEGGTANKVNFDETDQMSLFHGLGNTSTSSITMSGWQNAVYQGTVDEDELFTFTTKALVNPGYAVMVYPADIEFKNELNGNLGKNAPVISIEKYQPKDYRLKTPYMSEILEIKKPGEAGKGEAKAGYDQPYDIILKRVGSSLALTLDLKNDPSSSYPSGVAALEVESAKLRVDPENPSTDGWFTTAVSVSSKSDKPVVNQGTTEVYKSWVAQSDLDVSGITEAIDSLTTEDIHDGVAYFTLLPVKSTLPDGSDGQVVVYTNYGSVTIANSDTKVWKSGTTEMKLATGFEKLLTNDMLWAAATKAGTFKGELTGGNLPRTIQVDLSKLNMDKLHIKNADHLKDALAVYQAKYSSNTVKFILDGEEGVFTMDKDTWKAVEAQMAKSDNKLSIAPCVEENKCSVVVLENDGTAEEVPAITFAEAIDGTTKFDTVVLDGKWKYTSQEATNKQKKLGGFAHLVVAEGSTFDPQSFVAATGNFDITIEKGATVTIAGSKDIVVLGKTLYNKGTITIEEGGFFRAGEGGTIENCALEQDNKNSITGLTEGAGQIDNYGTLGIVETTTGQVYNYGVIDVKNEVASTLVSKNQADNANIATWFSNTNKIGSIIIPNPTGNGLTKITSNTGFVKIKIDKSNPSAAEVGSLANYVILGKNCTALTTNDVAKDVKGFPSSVYYIESHSNNVQLDGTFNIRALVVPEGTVQILNTCTVDIINGGQLYVKGKVTYAGKLTYKSATPVAQNYEGYFGGDKETDYKNVTKN